MAQSAPGSGGGGADRARGRGLMQPVALASPGVPAAAPEPGFGGHVWARCGRVECWGPDGTGVRPLLVLLQAPSGESGQQIPGLAASANCALTKQLSPPFFTPGTKAHFPSPFQVGGPGRQAPQPALRGRPPMPTPTPAQRTSGWTLFANPPVSVAPQALAGRGRNGADSSRAKDRGFPRAVATSLWPQT